MFTVFTVEQWNEAEPRVEKILAGAAVLSKPAEFSTLK
jgi:hypothetical protein